MRLLSVSIWIACAAAAAPASAMSPSVADVANIKSDLQRGDFKARAAWNALTFYLQGAMEAVGYSQTALEGRGDSGVFCPPKGQSLSMEDVFKMLDLAHKRGDDGPAIQAVMDSLQTHYPCTD